MLASQLPHDSPFMISLTGGDSLWGLHEQLLAGLIDLLQGANWQRGGGKGPKPKPLERPGIGADKSKTQFGIGRSRDELDELLRLHTGREVS